MSASRAPFYTAKAEAAIEEALQVAAFGQCVFVERLWALGYEVQWRGGRKG